MLAPQVTRYNLRRSAEAKRQRILQLSLLPPTFTAKEAQEVWKVPAGTAYHRLAKMCQAGEIVQVLSPSSSTLYRKAAV